MFRRLLKGGNLLTILTVVGVVLGLGLGFGLRASKSEKWSSREAMYLRLPGDLFLRTLSGLMLPLVFASLVSATGSLDLSLSKKIGLRALVYYVTTSALAAILGTGIIQLIGPGNKGESSMSSDPRCQAPDDGSSVDMLLDLLRNVFPPNLLGAALQNTRTLVTANNSLRKFGYLAAFEQWPISVSLVEGTNMIGLIVFALVLGITLGQMQETGTSVLSVFATLSDAMLKITSKLIWFGPVAVCFLISSSLVVQDDISEVFRNLGWYIGTMLLIYLGHGFILLPLLFTFLTRSNPIPFTKNIAEAIFTAFGTGSSNATLPITLKCLEENQNMDSRITRFLIPIGATVNMDGTAIGVPLRLVFIAQLCGRSLSFGDFVSITLTSVAASIGLAGIPGVAIVATMPILVTMGLPTEFIAYVLPVDWLQNRLDSVVNIVGDAYGAGIIGHLSIRDLGKI